MSKLRIEDSGKMTAAPRKRGFAAMDPQRVREIASMGGRTAHQKGTAHEFTSDEAVRAGRRSHVNRVPVKRGTV